MGKGLMKKKCPKCRKTKLVAEFCRNKIAKDGLNYWCRACAAKYSKNKDCRVAARKTHLKCNYNMTVDEYDELYQKQNGVCAICGKKESHRNKYGVRRLSVDHNHSTGKIRGLLCCTSSAPIVETVFSNFITAKFSY